MSPCRPGTVLVPSPDIVSRDIAGEHLLVPVRSGAADIDCLYTVDGTGGFVWACLDGRRDLEAVARLVAGAYEVDAERALGDVLAFADELGRAGLVGTAGEGR